MTREGSKKSISMSKKPKPVVDRLCRTRHMPPGALAVNTSRLKHDTRNKNTTSSTRQRKQASPPPQTTAPPPPPHTTATPPQPHTTTTLPPSHTNATPPPPQTTDTSPPTLEECTFVPTPGVTQQVLQGPPVNHTTVAVEEEERDQTVSDEEEEDVEQAFSGGQRPMISVVGNGLVPCGIVAEAIRKVLIKLYHGNFLQYSDLKARDRRKERDEYFEIFKSFVQWEPCYNAKIQDLFHGACGKRISDIFGKIRKKGTKPDWMGEKVYAYLLDGWKSDAFKKVSRQNKTNRASTRGGVHTTGRKSHHDVALELEKKLRRPPNSDELFMATHKRKNGQWVDRRAEKTHEDYVERLTQATQNNNIVDGSEKLQIWKEAAGGKSRGRCYGTGRMAVNIQYGVSCLTQVTIANPNREAESQAIEEARVEASRARKESALANARADEANARANEANARANEAKAETLDLKRKFEEFQKQMFAWQSGQRGTSIAPSSDHHSGHYDDDSDDQLVDLEEMNDG